MGLSKKSARAKDACDVGLFNAPTLSSGRYVPYVLPLQPRCGFREPVQRPSQAVGPQQLLYMATRGSKCLVDSQHQKRQLKLWQLPRMV